MEDADALNLFPPPPKTTPRIDSPTPAAEWHALSWRPAGSASLADRWLRAGERTRRADEVPPKLKRRR
jgi:hypothetical protein